MSIFGSIAVLNAPVDANEDWSFRMGELRFDVHDGVVKLQEECNDFEKFASSVDTLMMLIDHIDANNGRLEKVVFDVVNQNNELAQALGIMMPYSFATEAEEQAAGEDVKKAAEGQDGNGEEEQGFFARAWETIKKFFNAIINAIKNGWNKLTGKSEDVKKMNEQTAAAISNMTDAQVAAALKNSPRQLKISKDALKFKINACGAIANACNNMPKTPEDFIKLALKYNHPMDFLGVKDQLKDLGFVERTSYAGGEKKTELVRTKETAKEVSNLADWSKVDIQEFITNTSNKFEQIEGKIQYAANTLEKMLDQAKSDDAVLDRIAKSMVTAADYTPREHIKKKLFQSKADVNQHNAAVDKRNAAMKASAVSKKREKVDTAMLFGTEVAAASKTLLEIIATVKTEVINCAVYFNEAIAKVNAQKQAASNEQDPDAAEKAKYMEEAAKKASADYDKKQMDDAIAERGGTLGGGE